MPPKALIDIYKYLIMRYLYITCLFVVPFDAQHDDIIPVCATKLPEARNSAICEALDLSERCQNLLEIWSAAKD